MKKDKDISKLETTDTPLIGGPTLPNNNIKPV